MKRLLLILVQVGILAACVYYALNYLDFSRVLATLSGVPVWKVVAVLLFQAFLCWFGSAFRLYSLCRREAPFGTVLLAQSLAQFLNMLLPAKLGEAAKMALLARALDGGLARVTEVVFWERFSDLNALLLLALLSGALLGSSTLAAPLALVVAGVWGAVFILKFWGGFVEGLLLRLPWPRLAGYLVGVARALRERLSPGFTLGLVILTLPLWLGEVLVHGYMLGGVFGLDLTLVQIIAVSVVGMAGLSAPATPGSVGVYEAALVAALVAFGQGREESLAAALLMHGVMLLPMLVSGCWAMLRIGVKAALRLGQAGPG
ncbi:MAG: flippase-like domain-containing protein [Proteobacteria bacterium]|nr:flippase-like domain-containing protein [Pseudomonadota bacterium]MBU1596350.1 flippase-like domain-containing protein [Pseudomonadota bacterium]